MKDFDRILGNESIKDYFHSAIAHKKVSHAYIFEGEKGSGKKLITSIFAKLLQCESQEQGEKPCGKCTSCLQMENRNHPDVVWVTHEKPNTISVNDIREQVVNTVDVMPYKGPYKIYIIDEAEKMNHQAQNAILKTIEEPPEYAILFLLTSNRGAFLPTILSRCIHMSVKMVKEAEICRYLMEQEQIDRGQAEFYAGFAMGNLGRALDMASSESFHAIREHAISLMKNIHRMEEDELDEKVRECKEYKNYMADYFDMMRMWFRDLLILKTTGQKERVIFKTELVGLSQQGKLLPLESLNKVFDLIGEAQEQLRSNVIFEPAMDVLLFRIRGLFPR